MPLDSLRHFFWWFSSVVWLTANRLKFLRIFFIFLTNINNDVVWIVSTPPFISKSYSPFIDHLVTVPSAPTSNGIIVTFMFHMFLKFFSKLQIFIFLLAFFQFYPIISQNDKVHCSAGFLSFVDYHYAWSSGQNLVIRLYLQIPESFVFLIFQDRCWIVHIPFVRMVTLNFLHYSQWITFPTQSCQVLSFFTLHLIFCNVLSILALMKSIFMALFCATIWKDWVSLLRFPILCYFHDVSGEISFFFSLETSIQSFFPPFFFNCYFRALHTCVVWI